MLSYTFQDVINRVLYYAFIRISSHSKDVDQETSSFYNYYAEGAIYQALPNNNIRRGEKTLNQERRR
jgi:hypothetical protein